MTQFVVATRSLVAAVCLAASVYKWRSTSNIREDPASVALLVGLAFESIGWTLTVPNVGHGIDAWFGLTNLSILLMQLEGAVVFGPSLLIAVIMWANPPPVARRKALLAVVYGLTIGAIMIAFWIAAAVDTRSDEFLVQNMNRPLVIVYLVFYEFGFGAGLVVLMRLTWCYARRVKDMWFRRGLWITAFGAGGYLMVAINRLLSVPARLSGHDPMKWEAVTWICGRLGVGGVVIGLLLPSIAAHCGQVGVWWRYQRSYRALGDLWCDLIDTFPEANLLNANIAWQWYFRTEELRYLLNRRVIEIRDSWRALRPYLPNHSVEADDGTDRLAIAAASSLRAALLAKSTGVTGNDRCEASQLERLQVIDLEEDIDWLVRVGRAYSASRRTRHTIGRVMPVR